MVNTDRYRNKYTINVKKTLMFNKQCKGSNVTEGKQQKSFWV